MNKFILISVILAFLAVLGSAFDIHRNTLEKVADIEQYLGADRAQFADFENGLVEERSLEFPDDFSGDDDLLSEESGDDFDLPTFASESPERWLFIAESKFRLRKISNSLTKHDHVLAALPPEILGSVHLSDVSLTAGEPYEDLKKTLLSRFLPKPLERLSALLDYRNSDTKVLVHTLSNLLASADMIDLKELLIKEIAIRSLPASLQGSARTFGREPLEEFTERVNVLSTSSPSVAMLDSLDPEVSALHGRQHPNRQWKRKTKLCYYHEKFGAKAHRCCDTKWRGRGWGHDDGFTVEGVLGGIEDGGGLARLGDTSFPLFEMDAGQEGLEDGAIEGIHQLLIDEGDEA
eukprot:maker-scaffold79_size400133-snap-gene-1.10 protein:Tk03952 transcript:maker-scaffold79_size400133-snap-gene-1.10-mRNA-1 annotation:"PREDICTED: uncharacterized protein LOC101738874"